MGTVHNDQNVIQQVRAGSVIGLLTVHPGDTLNIEAFSTVVQDWAASGVEGAQALAGAMNVNINLATNLACSF